jgi:hypothetical protein
LQDAEMNWLPTLEFLRAHAVHFQALGSVILLSFFIVATTILQKKSLDRSRDLLNSATDAVRETALYKSAVLYMDRRSEAASGMFTSATYSLPIYFLVCVVFFCSIVTYFGAELLACGNSCQPTPSYVLGGVLAADPFADPDVLARVQSQTVFMASMAFLSAYVWVIGSLVNRINNYDTSPITFYYLSVRILTACLVAGIARHIIEVIPLSAALQAPKSETILLAVLGFLIGWNPSLWTADLLRWAAAVWRSGIPRQRLPNADSMPQSMMITQLQGLVDDKAARLVELDIDNCQKLACENAILIWLRTPYNLELIVDWIGQAQLCVLFEPEIVNALRQNGIRDIFSYRAQIADDASLAAMHGITKVSKEFVAGHRGTIDADPAFQRLSQLRKALGVT